MKSVRADWKPLIQATELQTAPECDITELAWAADSISKAIALSLRAGEGKRWRDEQMLCLGQEPRLASNSIELAAIAREEHKRVPVLTGAEMLTHPVEPDPLSCEPAPACHLRAKRRL